MPKVPTAAEIAAKWSRVAPGRQADFEAGVKDPSVDWQRGAAAAAGSYEAGVQEAISRQAFQRGIEATGNDRWRRNTAEKGAARWGAGVRAAEKDMEAGFAPYREAIERVVLPPRRPRGDPQNIERAAAMAKALTEVRRRG